MKPTVPRVSPDERGSALLVTILLTVVVAAFGATAVVMSNTNHLIAANERDSEKALFASRAGLEYGYHLFSQGLLAGGGGTTFFDSASPSVKGPLDGAAFTGAISFLSATPGGGPTYRIVSTGSYRRSNRTTEVVVGVTPEPFKYGYVAFDELALHNHSGVAGPSFQVRSTIFSNGYVEIPKNVTIDGNVVSGGDVFINTGATLKRNLFATSVWNSGTIDGNVKTLAVVDEVPDSTEVYDRVDRNGKKYKWYNGQNDPGDVAGGGKIKGTKSTYLVRNGDEFKYSLFRKDGRLIESPDLNVIRYVAPPKIDYRAMRDEALRYEPTYFATMTAAMSYLAGKKVTETIEGRTVTTIKVGNDTFPEFLYVNGDFTLKLDPAIAVDDPNRGILKADGFSIEGGIYAAGNISFNGPPYDPARHPAPPAWYQIRINALPYCFPALIAYRQPYYGTVDSWTADDTPTMNGTGSTIAIASAAVPHEGFVYLNGLTYSQSETHMHHTNSTNEMIRFNGAELAYKVHNCDFFAFTYDPQVRCSSFLPTEPGQPQVVSYREIR